MVLRQDPFDNYLGLNYSATLDHFKKKWNEMAAMVLNFKTVF